MLWKEERIKKKLMDCGNRQELYVMMLTMQSLHNRGITIRETVLESLENLLRWYHQSGDVKYLELALLHMQAYVNMGFGLDDSESVISEVLNLTGKSKMDFVPKGAVTGNKVKITRNQIRHMIVKWRSNKENPMTVNELVEDIMDKLKMHQTGRYLYQNRRMQASENETTEIYELVIGENESYFFDINRFRFYTFMEEDGNDKNCNS